MGWWTDTEDGEQKTGVGQRLWNWASRAVTTTVTYTANTLVYGLNQLAALRDSIPALASPESIQILKAGYYITAYKIVPLIVLNAANSYMQASLYTQPGQQNNGTGHEEEKNILWYQNTLMLAGTVVNWGVQAYTFRQGAELLVEITAVDTLAPSAFNSYKYKLVNPPKTPCDEQGCTWKRRVKGTGRETLGYVGKSLLTSLVSYYHYPTGLVLTVYFAGDMIVRSARLEVCEQHRVTDSELLLATGSAYTGAVVAMDYAFADLMNYFGVSASSPPLLVEMAMRHLLLLGFINNAAHMNIKYVEPGKGTLWIDPFIVYEWACRHLTDILFYGSMDKMKKTLQLQPDKDPVISISYVLQKLILVLNNDLETVNTSQPGFFKKTRNKVLPPMFRSTKDAENNPVISIFWPQLQEFLLSILKVVKNAGMPVASITKIPLPGVMTIVRNTLPKLVHREYGISPAVTEFFINLCKEDDFWGFVLALKQWLERHHKQGIRSLTPISETQRRTLEQHDTPKKSVQPDTHETALLDFPTNAKRSESAELQPRTPSLPLNPEKRTPVNTSRQIVQEIPTNLFDRRKELLRQRQEKNNINQATTSQLTI